MPTIQKKATFNGAYDNEPGIDRVITIDDEDIVFKANTIKRIVFQETNEEDVVLQIKNFEGTVRATVNGAGYFVVRSISTGSFNAGDSEVQVSGVFSVESPSTILFKDQYLSAFISLSETGTTELSGFTAVSIIGALNECKTDVGSLHKSSTDASSATPTPIGSGKFNKYTLTALAEAPTFAIPSGTPVDGNKLIIRIKDNGTARALTWNAIYREGSDVSNPITTTISKTMYCGFIYNGNDSKWDLVAVTNSI